MKKMIYSFFVGMLLVSFVVVGLNVFYPRPPYPVRHLDWMTESEYQTELERQEKWKIYEESKELYQLKMQKYSRNIFLISLFFAVLLMAVGLIYSEKINVIADGFFVWGDIYYIVRN